MAAPTESITTENVVTSTSVDQELNLEALRNDLSRAEYDPDRFPGLFYRTNDIKAASLVLRSGEVVITGARSEPADAMTIKATNSPMDRSIRDESGRRCK